MARPLVEETPRLRISALARAGVFAGASAVVTLDGSDLAVRAELADGGVHLSWRDGEQIVPVVARPLGRGTRRYFRAEDREETCLALYLVAGRFRPRTAAGLTYVTQRMDRAERASVRAAKVVARLKGGPERGPTRGAVRAALLEELRAVSPEHLTPDGQTELDRAEAQRRRQRRRRPLRRDPPTSTRWALLRGRKLGERMASIDVLSALAGPPMGLLLPPSGLPASVRLQAAGGVDSRPELDIRVLRPRAGRARGWKMVWEGRSGLWVVAAIPELPATRLVLDWSTGVDGPETPAVRQVLRLTGGRRRGDLFFICPVTGRRAAKLVLRDGRFASAAGQGLR